MPDQIVSLCYVSKRNDKSTELCRIADWIDGDFVPYDYQIGVDFYGTERDLIYGSTALLQAKQASIGVFVWSAHQNAYHEWRTQVDRAADASWCEVFYTKHGTIEQLARALKDGYPMAEYDRLHDIMLCCAPSGDKCDALYITKADAIYRDGKLCLLDSVITLRCDRLDTRYATGDCKCRYSPYDTRKYLARQDACRVVGTVEIRSRDEIIGGIIQQSIGSGTLSRKERQAARLALDTLSMPSVVERIAARFQCQESEAQRYAEEYIARTRQKLVGVEATQRLIEMLIDNDSDSVQRMRAAVQKQWDETQQEQIKAARQRQAETEASLDAIQKQIAEAHRTLEETQTRQAQAEAKTREAFTQREQIEAQREQIEAEIQKRLEGFKSDYARALVENAAIASTLSASLRRDADGAAGPGRAKWKIILPENAADVGALDENLDAAVENWGEICADRDMARGLTLLSFAAYAQGQPLLLVGEGAISVSDLISSSICGQPAIRIHAADEPQDDRDIMEEIEKRPEAVVCLINGLKNGYEPIRELLLMCPRRMFVVTEMHVESLVMEPPSLFTVFLPVLCDYFYTGRQALELPTRDCSGELHDRTRHIEKRSIKEAKAAVSRWLHDGFYPPVLKERCAGLLAAMNLLARPLGIGANDVLALAAEFLFTPLLKCMRKENALKTHIEACTVLGSDRKAALIDFIGTED